ncbi:class I SAM-dependent methyltransferase [Kordiimonas sp.]|uniref:class I SAM-dependent methyltransferase n=1 Tax=Kordiimonas sp. TaxID=1970157 RepID=UPI003B519A4B
MSDQNDKLFRELFLALMHRPPHEGELSAYFGNVAPPKELSASLRKLLQTPERASIARNQPFPPGHYYSPVIDVADIERRRHQIFDIRDPFFQIQLDPERLHEIWEILVPYLENISFPHDPSDKSRYYWGPKNQSFPFADAAVWSAMLQWIRPKRVIEVGSGFSSAVLFDTQEFWLDYEMDITFIQPNPYGINKLLQKQDHQKYTLKQCIVQEVETSLFTHLEAGDILFIDSTHVAKTGSDVLFEIFEILPRLAPGVHVHFHDIFDSFEYPQSWIIGNGWSWNEQYLLRAYLMNNADYEVQVFNNHYIPRNLTPRMPHIENFKANPGGSLWLKKIG